MAGKRLSLSSSNSTLKISVYSPKVLFPSICTIDADPSDTIRVLKVKIHQKKEDLIPEKHELFFLGKEIDGKYLFEVELEESCTISDYNITEGARFEIRPILRIIVLERHNLGGTTLSISPSAKVADLKQKIQGKLMVPCYRQHLLLLGKKKANSSEEYVFNLPLSKDNALVSDYPIQDGSVIRLLCQIYVTSSGRDTISVLISKGDSAKDLKYKIWEQTGIQCSQQLLYVKSRILFDIEIIADNFLDYIRLEIHKT